MKTTTHLAVVLAIAPYIALAAPQTPPNLPVLAERGETPEQHDRRMEWFRDAHFGMFIHWGLYAQAGGFWKGKETKVNNCAEWLMCAGKVPIAEYAALAQDFNPVRFDADQWVRAAKDAGMKYIVITSKHHEGFAMFQSKASDFNIVDATPFKRDPLKDIAAACRKHGVKLGFYYSQNLDWHHPGGGSGEWDPAHKGDADKYVDDIVIPQLREILTHYGDISVLWFDISNGIITKARAERIMKAVLACNPNLILNNRLGGGYHGDIETPEQHIPPMGFPGRDWESCMTMNKTWGFAKNDHDWKSTTTLLHNLCDIASKGGNYLLNVGPTELGEIPAPSLERLAEIGAWMRTNGPAIHGVRASVFPQLPEWGRVTTRLNADGTSTLYAIVFDTPKSGVLNFPGLNNRPAGANILGSDASCQAVSDGESVTVTLPQAQRVAHDFVVAIRLQGVPKVDDSAHANAAGIITLSPRQAKTTDGLRPETIGADGLGSVPEECLGYWTRNTATAAWSIKSTTAGQFTVKARVGAPAESAGSVIEFVCGDQVLALEIKATGDWKKFADATAGTLQLPAGASTLTVRVKTVKGVAPCNLAKVTLTPVK
jgi:alpha-L-fucosidase